jgi:hypothetical protein
MVVGFQRKDESSRAISELLRNAGLQHPIAKAKFERLIEIHDGFRRTQAKLVTSLEAGEISADQYLRDFNSALREAMTLNEIVLGHPDFVAIFGKAGQALEGLIDRDAFFSDTQHEPPRFRTR